jgi:hypothetical protein
MLKTPKTDDYLRPFHANTLFPLANEAFYSWVNAEPNPGKKICCFVLEQMGGARWPWPHISRCYLIPKALSPIFLERAIGL